MDIKPPVQHPTSLDYPMSELRDELLAFLRRRVPNHYEELAQDTWLRIARAQPSCKDQRSFRAYTFAVARRLIIDHHRRNANRPMLVALDAVVPTPSAEDPHSQLCVSEVINIVHQELDNMKPEVAEVFRWRMTDKSSFRDIAERQGVSINTALGRMHHATKRLAAALQRAGWSQGGTQ